MTCNTKTLCHLSMTSLLSMSATCEIKEKCATVAVAHLGVVFCALTDEDTARVGRLYDHRLFHERLLLRYSLELLCEEPGSISMLQLDSRDVRSCLHLHEASDREAASRWFASRRGVARRDKLWQHAMAAMLSQPVAHRGLPWNDQQ